MGRNYFELCNEILTELFYEKVDTFEELSDITEGIKVKQDLNAALLSICNNEDEAWKFRQIHFDLALVPGVKNYKIPNGFIDYMRYDDTPIVLVYQEDHQYLPDAEGMPTQYWIEDDEIVLYPKPSKDMLGRLIKIELWTNWFAKDECGIYKDKLTEECDEPIIPEQHRDILKWKVCADWRASVNDAKAQFYLQKYRKAYAALSSSQRLSKDYPAGINIMPMVGNTAQWAIMNAFYNPRVGRIN